jgi:hypothetical protein
VKEEAVVELVDEAFDDKRAQVRAKGGDAGDEGRVVSVRVDARPFVRDEDR